MRTLLPEPEFSPDLHEVYARDWLEPGGLRVNFVSSADGAVAVQGLSKGLQTPGDNRVFAVLRDLADVVLVGAGTARAESYRPVQPDDRRAEARARLGFAAALPVALVSARLDLDPDGPLFRDTTPGSRTIIITHQAADADRLARLGEVADVVLAGADQVDLASARSQLAERGLRRVLCEGGPGLFGNLVAAGVVDELCLTLSPKLAGTGAGRIISGLPWPDGLVPELTISALLEEDHALFFRYRIGQ